MRTRTLAVVLLVCAACGGQTQGTVSVRFDEFTVDAQPQRAPAGPVRFEQHNDGAIEHELVVIRTRLQPDALPIRIAEVDLEAKTLDVVASDRRLATKASRTLRAELSPGRYVLICNVPGHYQSGMRTGFVVR